MLLQVTHETRYEYVPTVETAQHMLHLKPRQTSTQKLLEYELDISPEPSVQSDTIDVYNNTRTFFSLQGVHNELVVTARSIVETRDPPLLSSLGSAAVGAASVSWESVREHFRYHKGTAYDPAAEFVFASPYVPRHADFMAYARPSFATGVPLLMAAHDLMERIHTDFDYDTESTEVNTPTLEALALRKGVCQDFAHIMVACFRSMGLPARYVSGYLLTHPAPGQPRLVGADASHAWASIYVPGLPNGGWCDFDPTNNRTPGEDYVFLATGRDFSDVSPLRGVIHGGRNHTLHVGVTVEPISEAEAEPVA